MSNEKNIRIVRGEARFAGSPNNDVQLQPFLESTQKQIHEGDRNLVLDLRDQFDFERAYSTQYRLYGKIDILYNNIISGSTQDTTFMRSMYFIPDFLGCPQTAGVPPTTCSGLPPASTFTIIPPKRYGIFASQAGWEPLLAHQDNWVQYISYVNDADSNQRMMYYTDYSTNSGMQFVSGDGIPFIPITTNTDGKEVLQIITPVRHGVLPGEYIEIQSGATTMGSANLMTNVTIPVTFPSPAGPQTIFKVDYLGNGLENSEDYVMNITTVGLDVTSIPANPVGTLKRVINPENMLETKSEYYCQIHKLITNPNDLTVDKTGFERGIYNKRGRVFPRKRTPDYIQKSVLNQAYDSFLWNCNYNINSDDYYDQFNRPLTEFYLTILTTNRNLIWDWNPGINSPAGYGWGWNFKKNGVVDPFVDNGTSPVNLTQTGNQGVNPLPLSGSTFRGAFAEYNPFELKERVISEIGHSLKFNRNTMYKVGGTPGYDFVESIFKYNPHHKIPIRKFSNYISYNDSLFTSPQYAVYSLSEETFRWREILPVEAYEDGDNGVSYPYLNDAHYPYHNLEFKIEAVGPALIPLTSGTISILTEYTDGCQ
tara:strand:- start:2112 stop:3896 length:1785 start_codon:yes stop_codon:yes gene_type:complete